MDVNASPNTTVRPAPFQFVDRGFGFNPASLTIHAELASPPNNLATFLARAIAGLAATG
jgi:hypothetical protein